MAVTGVSSNGFRTRPDPRCAMGAPDWTEAI